MPQPQPWYSTLAVFDLETTGIDVATSRIVSANVSVIDAGGAVIERQDWLADPGVEIPLQASNVHGITTQRAQSEGMPAAAAVSEIVAAIRSVLARELPLVVFNAPYDITLLRHEAIRHGVEPLVDPSPIVDPLVIDKAMDQYRRGKRTLEAAAVEYGVELSDAHDAGADAIAAGRVAQAIARRNPDRLEVSARELHGLQVEWSAQQSASFADYMRRTHNPNFVETSGWPER
ncbi:3'-5' exonuclease [Terrimesophilobacter mesophilus]|uniref:3'-5' exonuclease n=1 Tax=Terrimesophilobacter mesophilus TaxID=433647 RepID=A0A4R8VDX2_9MICO|nr:exonuclease domain-containing protein [Terrimesophilobacter mesophilus]TFB80686.1 3'-5' exonuclease [Terrimesophilobacter mesophilus]